MRWFCKIAVGSLLIVVLGANPVLSKNLGAKELVAAFQASLLDVMKRAKKLSVKGRFDILGPIIEDRFHLPLMIATASAPYWKEGSAEQRTKLLAAFRRMSASTLATLFDDYNGEIFRIERERKSSGRVVIVDTQIVRKRKDPVNISYVAADLQGRWWLIDIIVSGGISEVKVRRNEYRTFLKEGGLDRLTAALEAKADGLLSGTENVTTR